MRAKSDSRLTPRQRLTRGLTYTAVGPVDITRGALGLTINSSKATAGRLRSQYRKSQVAHQIKAELAAAQESIANEISAAQELVASLPQAFQESRAPKRRLLRRPVVIAGIGVATIAAGAVVFSIVRRSMQPEPSPRPPSVDVAPRP